MPPRKSTASNPPDEGAETTPASKGKKDDSVGVEDLSLPKSMIARLAKGVLPANTQIQKDALLALHKSATVFVSYIASNSNDLAHIGGKKTISPQDVMSALKDAELEGFLPRLEGELKKYNEVQCDKRNSYRHRVKQEKAAAAATDTPNTTKGEEEGDEDIYTTDAAPINGMNTNGHMHTDDAERPAKKLKGADGVGVEVLDDDENDDDDDDGGDEGEDEDEGPDETMEDVDDGDDEEGEEEEEEVVEADGSGPVRDEALDEGGESD